MVFSGIQGEFNPDSRLWRLPMVEVCGGIRWAQRTAWPCAARKELGVQ